MKNMVIRTTCRVFGRPRRPAFDDRRPVVIAYCVDTADDSSENGLPQQIRDIRGMLRDTYGPRGCNVIWIIEESDGCLPFPDPHVEYRQGRKLVAELIRQGSSRTLAVQRISVVTESIGNWFRFYDDVIEPYHVKMLIARRPPAGSRYDVEYIDWLIRFDQGEATLEDQPHARGHADAGESQIGPGTMGLSDAKTGRSGCQTGQDGGPEGSQHTPKRPNLSSDDGTMFVDGSRLIRFTNGRIRGSTGKRGTDSWIS